MVDYGVGADGYGIVISTLEAAGGPSGDRIYFATPSVGGAEGFLQSIIE